MAYEKEKDKVLIKRTISGENRGLDIGIYSYDGGEPKIQISRWVIQNGEKRYVRLGRITFEDFNIIVQNVAEMAKEIPEYEIELNFEPPFKESNNEGEELSL